MWTLSFHEAPVPFPPQLQLVHFFFFCTVSMFDARRATKTVISTPVTVTHQRVG